MVEEWKGCIGLDITNNEAINSIEIYNITVDDITNHLNKECKEIGEVQHNNSTKVCFCDSHNYCNGSESARLYFYKITVLLLLVFF